MLCPFQKVPLLHMEIPDIYYNKQSSIALYEIGVKFCAGFKSAV